MHDAAYLYVSQFATPDPVSVVELGSLDINGSVRPLFPNADYTGVDLVPGAGVDAVGDAAVWRPDAPIDVVVCCEVLEHTDKWAEIITNAASMLRAGGRLIVTCAGPGRPPHSAVDGGALRPDEYYGNLNLGDLYEAFVNAGLVAIEVDQLGDDVRGTGVR